MLSVLEFWKQNGRNSNATTFLFYFFAVTPSSAFFSNSEDLGVEKRRHALFSVAPVIEEGHSVRTRGGEVPVLRPPEVAQSTETEKNPRAIVTF